MPVTSPAKFVDVVRSFDASVSQPVKLVVPLRLKVPFTWSNEVGAVVPMPTLPVLPSICILVLDELSTKDMLLLLTFISIVPSRSSPMEAFEGL